AFRAGPGASGPSRSAGGHHGCAETLRLGFRVAV
ncbi:MAG: hypothetical protein AVDCRST_MAG27-2320, partial [uncultured Craurococcus sp.]